MRPRTLIATLAVGAALAAAVPAMAPADDDQPLTGVIQSMTCVAPGDAAGIDAILGRAGSPLAGQGATFVAEGRAAGIDPRFLLAVAAHETMLETYGPAQAIRNPFGLGPGWSFATEADAIRRAAQTLSSYYLAEGRQTIPRIGSKWAPLGAANDPAGLNANWNAGVGAYYRALGGDPDLPVLAAGQSEGAECAGGLPAAPSGPAGRPVVTAWGGAIPRAAGPAAFQGGDPATGSPATLPGFVFPLALAPGARAAYRPAFNDPGGASCNGAAGRQCAITIASDAGVHVVASSDGVLREADAAARAEGIAFWIETPSGDRLGYGPLVAYADGIGPDAPVRAGQPLGLGSGSLRITWQRGDARIDPFPLLEATRPPTS